MPVRRKLLGLAVLLGAVLVAVLLWQRPDPFSSNEVLSADVRDANGLAPIGADPRTYAVFTCRSSVEDTAIPALRST